jgi:hypothetical protein
MMLNAQTIAGSWSTTHANGESGISQSFAQLTFVAEQSLVSRTSVSGSRNGHEPTSPSHGPRKECPVSELHPDTTVMITSSGSVASLCAVKVPGNAVGDTPPLQVAAIGMFKPMRCTPFWSSAPTRLTISTHSLPSGYPLGRSAQPRPSAACNDC